MLDEAFVDGAVYREGSGHERAAQATRIASAHRSVHAWRVGGTVVEPTGGRPLHTRRGSRRRAWRERVVLLLVVGALAGAWAGGLLPSLGAGGSPTVDARLSEVGAPAPREEPAASKRLLPAPAVPTSQSGGFAFLRAAEDGRSPVSWDPCRPVRYVVRPAGQAPAGAALLRSALAEVSAATGLRFVDGGVTEEPPGSQREPYQPQRYGRGWAPVLIVWSDPAESPELAGDVAGYAGPASYARAGQRQRYVSGQVVLDAPQLSQLLARPGGAEQARGVVLHELAHLAGLGHVDDPSQLMNPSDGPGGPVGYQAGDLHGLAMVGAGGCR